MKTHLLVVATLLTACGSGSSSSTVSALDVTPSPCAVGQSDSVQMTATATLADGTKMIVTDVATWSTENAQTATVNGSGVVVGVNGGVTSIDTSYQGATSKLDCTVSP